jgi:hypothetical protein
MQRERDGEREGEREREGGEDFPVKAVPASRGGLGLSLVMVMVGQRGPIGPVPPMLCHSSSLIPRSSFLRGVVDGGTGPSGQDTTLAGERLPVAMARRE